MDDFIDFYFQMLRENYASKKNTFCVLAYKFCRENNLSKEEQKRVFPELMEAVMANNTPCAEGCKLLNLFDTFSYRDMFLMAESVRDWYKLLQFWSGEDTRDARVLTALAKIFAFHENDVAFYADDFAFGRSKDGLFAISITETFFVNEDGSEVSKEEAQKEEGLLRGAKLYGNMVFDDDNGRVEVENVYMPEGVITATVNALEKRGISLIPLTDVGDFFSTRETRKNLLRRSIQMRSGK